MKKSGRKFIRTAALAFAVMAASVSSMAAQGVFPNAQITASAAYGPTDTNYTVGTSGNLKYYKYSDHIEAYSCTDGTTSLTIPSTIDGLPVTAIARYAFQCSSITSISIPESVKTIGYYAFSTSSNLQSVTLPSSLEVMEMHAFEDCSSLDTVKFPNKFIEIHDKCFDSTPWLKAQRQQDSLVIVNGALIDAKTAKGDVTIPSSVKYVSPSAFARNNDVTSVVFPTGVKEVCDNTFFYCENLTSVDIKGATYIGLMAFSYCNRLSELKLSGDLTKIEDYAFSDINGSANITFYGSRDKWENVTKPSDMKFLNNSNFTFDTSYTPDPEPQGDDYPKNVRAITNSQYHQIQFIWDKVQGADKYGIAVYLAGKWRVQTSNITNNSYVTPKNLTPGMTYRVAVAARVNGKWNTTDPIKNAITVTVR
ncbi:MAG: leucine-rich repeat domain-containing protein [Ruminococcus albus]|nr:leucine-rich repeat domain-containing protein [Ruminococcus albus]